MRSPIAFCLHVTLQILPCPASWRSLLGLRFSPQLGDKSSVMTGTVLLIGVVPLLSSKFTEMNAEIKTYSPGPEQRLPRTAKLWVPFLPSEPGDHPC